MDERNADSTASMLHIWVGPHKYFVGSMHDQTTKQDCIEADEGELNAFKAAMENNDPNLELMVETIGNETSLRHRKGKTRNGMPTLLVGEKLLSFFRDRD